MSLINNKLDFLAKKLYNGNNSRFARDFDVSDNTIRRYRKDKAPSFDFIMHLVKNLGINWEWLVHDRGDMINKDGQVEVSEPSPAYNTNELISMQREYIESLKQNIKLLQHDLEEQRAEIERLKKKSKDE